MEGVAHWLEAGDVAQRWSCGGIEETRPYDHEIDRWESEGGA